jgi:hypothetical protein
MKPTALINGDSSELVPCDQTVTPNRITQQWDYVELPTDDRNFVKERAAQIRELARRTAESIVVIGQYLSEVKERLRRGRWLPWLECEFGWSQPKAWRYMQVYEMAKKHSELFNLNNLMIDVSALYLIAAPKTPEPVRKEMVERARAGEHVTHAQATEVLKHYEATTDILRPAVGESNGHAPTAKVEEIAARVKPAAQAKKGTPALRTESCAGCVQVAEWLKDLRREITRRRVEMHAKRSTRWAPPEIDKLRLVELVDYIEQQLDLVDPAATALYKACAPRVRNPGQRNAHHQSGVP